ncbi:MAG: trimethylamine methyltransferase family protein [Deltaproteobacteria bacterium]|uniref:Trimethylamine methyltransferase family protein n=1 Tax=Candidatus Desulfacyla euxinica TaxID=2841693 RepID=A0A8J6N1S0_9DELT|nr:trimethylamine methyltransferase family protein [Candidatus Desulfacyla euxinica]
MGSEKEAEGRSFPNSMEMLSSQAVDKMIKVIFQFLEETGVKFDKHEHAYDLLSKAGCDISSDDIVKFPSKVVEEYLSYVPKSFEWWNRAGTEFVEYGSGNACFIADAKAPNYIDPSTGEKRQSNQDGAALMVHLCDAMPEMDICGTPLTTDNFIADNATTVLNTSKPVYLIAGDKTDILKAAVEMGAAIRGGIEELKGKPYLSTLISPEVLHNPKTVIEQIQLCTENNVPTFLGPMPIGGVSSPVTIAGTLIVCLASTLPGIILAQLFKKGHPCVDSSYPSFMDPSTGGLGGIPENSMADMARSQICRKLGILLSQQTSLGAITPEFNQDCIAEITWDFGRLSTSSFDSFWGSGCVGAGMVFSPHSLIYGNELASAARRVWKGIPVDEDNLAIDKIKTVKSSMYIMEEHTALHSRKDLWRGKYSLPLRGAEGGKDLFGRIDDHLKKILETHEVEPLSELQQKAINDIVEKYKG